MHPVHSSQLFLHAATKRYGDRTVLELARLVSELVDLLLLD